MTDETMALRQMLEKGSDATFLREMIGFAAQRPMELEVGEVTGAAHGERSPDRLVQRNGYRDREWQTRVGTVELRRRTDVPDHSQGGGSASQEVNPENPRKPATQRGGWSGGGHDSYGNWRKECAGIRTVSRHLSSAPA